MESEASQAGRKLWKPHPDDEAEVTAALASVEQGEVLSAEASAKFLSWLEGDQDESWREDCALPLAR